MSFSTLDPQHKEPLPLPDSPAVVAAALLLAAREVVVSHGLAWSSIAEILDLPVGTLEEWLHCGPSYFDASAGPNFDERAADTNHA